LYTYLTMTAGQRVGDSFLLDEEGECLIGRGLDCTVTLNDPLCSRVHAVVGRQDDGWVVRDANSRNGTYVNDQKIDEATLGDGHLLRLGSTVFAFHQSEDAPTIGSGTGSDIEVTQTLIKDAPVTSGPLAQLSPIDVTSPEQTRQLALLHELSIKLLACDDPKEVVRIAVELLLKKTKAAVVGFLWVSDEGRLKVKLVMPESGTGQVVLSESLTDLVCQKRHAVWIANQHFGERVESLEHYADALCVPLVSEDVTLGAVHLYREEDRFQQADFDFAISVANVVVIALVRARRQRSLEANYDHLVRQSPGYSDLVGECPQMLDLKARIQRVGRVTGCVLVSGESGVGKELVARAIHQASPRADRPLLPVNCAAIPSELMESQLFGHKKGAFTGAESDHRGYFEQADLGTLFLDEVGEMTLDGQAKLLRILEGHPFLPVGGTDEVSVDVRVIAVTNQDLMKYVKEKKFREDLYYRLSVFELVAPPLRERGDDIELLVDFFLDHFRTQHGHPDIELSSPARKKLLVYPWPGNVRQLRNVLDSAIVLAEGDQIEVHDLMLHDAGGDRMESLRIDHWERRLIGEALRRAKDSVPEAAKLLGLGRATLYRKIEEYGISR
jgi:Nif-specific regulatory protein